MNETFKNYLDIPNYLEGYLLKCLLRSKKIYIYENIHFLYTPCMLSNGTLRLNKVRELGTVNFLY